MPPLMPFFLHFTISVSVSIFSSTFVFFRQICKTNPGTDGNQTGFSTYISKYLFLKLLNNASSNVSLCTYNHGFDLNLCIRKSFHTLLAFF